MYYPTLQIASLDEDFTCLELDAALKCCNNSSPGLDQISFPMIKNIDQRSRSIIVQLFTEFSRSQRFPTSWLDCKVIALLKPDKNTDEASSYRPICLLSCMRKLFEKIIQTRLDHWLESTRKSSPSQFGFKKGFGTQDCIAVFSTDLDEVFARKHICLAVFMDITAAYDNVQINILCSKLASLDCSYKMIKTIFRLFATRRLHFFFNRRLSEVRTCIKGLAQGSTLSLLFNILTSDIGTRVPGLFKILQYADDVVIYASGIDKTSIQVNVQSAVNAISHQYKQIGLDISPTKSEFMVFSRKYKLPSFRVSLGNRPLTRVFEFKYLGIVFDPKCSWKLHVNSISKRCQMRINFMRTISGTNWGSHPDALLLLYKTTIRPVLEYGAIAFANLAKNNRIRLERIQWRALRTSLGLMQSTHTGSLEAQA